MLPARVLVDLPNWVGDVVMALPAVAEIVRGNRDSETVLHCRPPVASLLEAVFEGASVVATPKRESLPQVVSLVRNGGPRFEVGVTLRHAARAKLILRLAAQRSLGSDSEGGRMVLSDTVTVDRDRHQIHDFNPLLELMGLEPVDSEWRPELPEATLAAGRDLLAATVSGRGRPVGLVPSAAWGGSKRWPSRSWGALAVELLGRGQEPVVLVGPDEEPVAAEVREAAGLTLPVLGPRLDILGLAGLLAQLPVVVSNDSGPMHLAAAAGSRVVGLFGPTDPSRTAPLGEGNLVVRRELDCAPCFETTCPLEHHACMEEIGVDEVLGIVLAALAND